MLLVNTPGSWSAIYPPLRHAEWHGWTPTDLIFPFFLFIVGITTYISMQARRARGDPEGRLVRQILKRGAVIFLLGLLLSGFPFYDPQSGRFFPELDTLRIPGVLQRIAVCYVAAALITMRTSLRQQVLVIVALLFGYWFLMTLVPVPGRGMGALLLDDRSGNLAAYVDRLLLEGHLWRVSRTWDPEGILSTIPAIGTTMMGVLAGRWLRSPRLLSDRLAAMFAVGAIGAVAGLMWGWSFPINKNLWTSSYALFTAGMACLTLATCMWVVDVHRVTWWTRPFVIFGVNPIAAYVGAGLVARLIYTTIRVEYEGAVVPVQTVIYRELFASWLPPMDASLLFAISYVLFWLLIMWLLYRKGVFLKA
jgi:predicted acyltransferase